MKIVRREEESLESLLRRWKNDSAEIVADYKKHTVYVPKSLKKKLKHQEHLKRIRREEREKEHKYE